MSVMVVQVCEHITTESLNTVTINPAEELVLTVYVATHKKVQLFGSAHTKRQMKLEIIVSDCSIIYFFNI